jgi:glutamate 5-kinase
VKLGTQVVTRDDGRFALGSVTGIMETLARARASGQQVLLVTSGAVGLGARELGMAKPRSLGLRQACAAVGQSRLMMLYTQIFEQLGVKVGQVLLTSEDLADPDRALCLRTTLLRLLELDVIPVLNENDSVSVRELLEHRRAQSLARGDEDVATDVAFGDNDMLSARVAAAIDAELLVLLTNVDGLYTANPTTDPSAQRIPVVDVVDEDALARTAGTSALGTGGMTSKLEAARLATAAGCDVLITDGTTAGRLDAALRGEDVGTWIPTADALQGRKRDIALGREVHGALVINDGAVTALRNGKASLLPIGVLRVEGTFTRRELVEIRDASGRVIGRGLANYDATEARTLAGKHSDDIADLLGYRGYDALVNRENLVVGEV